MEVPENSQETLRQEACADHGGHAFAIGHAMDLSDREPVRYSVRCTYGSKGSFCGDNDCVAHVFRFLRDDDVLSVAWKERDGGTVDERVDTQLSLLGDWCMADGSCEVVDACCHSSE